ncbi:unnamed protein product [Ectocarpus sp. CCAP 1310/34]|nr:unnamed protein product [Ectocarpus sp. CCAP 1310/34]
MLQAINTLLHRVMWRYTKAHMQSTREDLSEGQLVGEDRLHEDFLAQIGTLESVVCKCTRKARAWGRLSNGGYSSTNAKAFQEGFWYSMLQFMTGPRRHASGILTIPKSDFGNPKIMRFLSPYVGGNDNLVVEETPAEDVESRFFVAFGRPKIAGPAIKRTLKTVGFTVSDRQSQRAKKRIATASKEDEAGAISRLPSLFEGIERDCPGSVATVEMSPDNRFVRSCLMLGKAAYVAAHSVPKASASLS